MHRVPFLEATYLFSATISIIIIDSSHGYFLDPTKTAIHKIIQYWEHVILFAKLYSYNYLVSQTIL